MTARGSIVQLSVSGDGVPKLPVAQACVAELGLAGDDHDDKQHHGGPTRAVCLFAIERIEALAAEGHHVAPGTTGENVTTRGIDWDEVTPGMQFRLGDECLIEVTSYTAPCSTIEHNFSDRDFNRMSQKVHPGWSRTYARVLVPGTIRAGDPIEVVKIGVAAG
ncbi:MAG: MOSC domain-containing protein [Anaerolinea sp.]|nr:MOSC domain-containing protein [Anaerolinea sp.]